MPIGDALGVGIGEKGGDDFLPDEPGQRPGATGDDKEGEQPDFHGRTVADGGRRSKGFQSRLPLRGVW